MISINGEPVPEADGATLSMVLVRMGLDPGARGVAVAVDGEVIPRSRWTQFELGGDSRVEILAAMQGG